MMRDVGREVGVGRRRRRKQRTPNMGSPINCMSVTLEVSKLSGWLNAVAFCRVERRTCEAGGIGAWGREGVGRRRMQRAGEDPIANRGQGTRGAHIKHGGHVCDAGRVKIQRLVEHPCFLSSRKGGMRAGRREGDGAAVAHVTCGRGPNWGLGPGHAWSAQ